MDRPAHQDDSDSGASSRVPALIHDYRAQRDAWREQARNLARMREEVLAAADGEARDIVSTARADIRKILLKARRDLLVLAAQVRAAGRLGEPDDPPDTVTFLPADDLGQVREVVTSARHDVRRALDESRPELEGLAAEGEALRAALRQQRPNGSAPATASIAAPPAAPIPVLPVRREEPAETFAESPIDFEFTPSVEDEDPDLSFGQQARAQRQFRLLASAAAVLGLVTVAGTAWWFLGRDGDTNVTTSESSVAADPATDARSGGADAASTGSRPAANAGTLSLDVSARRQSWIRLTVDGRVAAERVFKAGERQRVTAVKEVSVRAGDAGAVFVSVDNREAVALGAPGEVVTRRFAVEALRVEPRSAAPAATSAAGPTTTAAAQRAPVTSPPPQERPLATPTGAPPPPLPSQSAAVSASPAPVTAPQAAATVGARPAPPERSSAAPPAPTSSSVSLQDSLTSATSRWLDAYYRQDRSTMNAISISAVNVADERADNERLPRGLTEVRRTLEDVRMNMAGSDAILTARMTERMDDPAAGRMSQSVSFISHVWTQRNGTWLLQDVRIVSASSLSRALR